MDLWIIAIIVGLLLVVGFVAVTTISMAKQPEKVACESCGGKCTADSNCGLETCQAVNGGTCGCGK